MHTENTLWMKARPERVFDFAQDIARWPERLPHYRWVKVLQEGEGERLAEMSARRSVFPVKWRAVQRLFPAQHSITYQHVGGLTTGMEVQWILTLDNGGTRVTIVHDLKPRSPFLRGRPAAWIIGDFFVKGIADRTLFHLKRAVEQSP